MKRLTRPELRRLSNRKQRLLTCACIRDAYILTDRRVQEAVKTAEAYADGLASKTALNHMWTWVGDMRLAKDRRDREAGTGAMYACGHDALLSAYNICYLIKDRPRQIYGTFVHPHPHNKLIVNRDVIEMARCLYEERFKDLEMLGPLYDALEEAGSEGVERRISQFYRGWWLTDKILGQA